jgi:hypothetical protein
MRSRHLQILAFSIGLALSMLLVSSPTSAALAWSDDFDDGNHDGWTVSSGEFAVVDGRLTVTGSEYSDIWRESTVTEGTWSFDWIDPDNDIRVGEVDFMAMDESTLSGTAFLVAIAGNDIWLGRASSGSGDILEQYHIEGAVNPGVHHFDVTHKDGHFEVFHDGTHGISHDAALLWNLDFQYFLFAGDSGALDNVIVSDTIDVVCDNETCVLEHAEIETATTTTTTTTEEPTATTTTTTDEPPAPIPVELMAVGIGVPVVIVFVALIWRSRSS